MKTAPLMKCGCVAHATIGDTDDPACVIHSCYEVAESQPNLEGRTAKCAYNCGDKRPSSLGLAFFAHKPEEPEDSYYCGCRGWD